MLTDIPYLCKKRNVTLSHLAERCGVSVGYLSLITKGKRKNVSYNILENIADELDISVSDLLGDTLAEAPAPDIHSLSAVLHFWEVSSDEVHNFIQYFKSMDQDTREAVSGFFCSYEQELIDRLLEPDYTENQLNLIIIAALHDGIISSRLTSSLIKDDPLPFNIIKARDDSFQLRLRFNHILKRFRRKIPLALGTLEKIWETEFPMSQVYLKLALLCDKHNYSDLSLNYYGNAALYARGEENRENLEESITKVRKMPASPLRRLITSWYRGLILSGQGLYEKAYDAVKGTLTFSPSGITEQRFLSRNHSTSGNWFAIQGRYKEALKHFRESIRLWSDGPLAPATYINMGSLMRRIGRLHQAKKYFELAIESKEPFILPTAMYALGLIAFDEKDHVKARRLILEGYIMGKTLNRELGRTEIYINLGAYYKELGKYNHSIYLLELAHQRATRFNDTRAICYTMLEKADTYIHMNRIDEAQKVVELLPDFIEGQSDLLLLGFWLNSKGKLYLSENQPGVALTFLKQAYLTLGQGASISYEYLKCIRLMEQTYIALHEPHQVQFFHDEGVRQRRKLSKQH